MKLIKLETDLGNEPNDKTKKVIEKTDAGINVAKFKSVKNFMANLRKRSGFVAQNYFLYLNQYSNRRKSYFGKSGVSGSCHAKN